MGFFETEAVVLGIDPALHTSGAAILLPDYGNSMLGEAPHPFVGNYTLFEFGKVCSQSERERYITTLLDLSEEFDLPPVVIAEEWDGPRDRKIRLPGGETGWARDPKWTYTTIMGIGEGWGRWSAEIEMANEIRREEKSGPDIIMERALPNDWRDEVFGHNRPKDTESLKATAVRFFHGVFGYAVIEDVAEAGCIAICGLRRPSVAAAVAEWGNKMLVFEAEEKAEARAVALKKRKKAKTAAKKR